VAKQAADPYKKWSIWPKNLTTKGLVKEYTAWMQDRWNHASVIVWDAQNETWATQTGEAIQQVRKLDLSNRVWDNGWSPPVAPGDIREAHPYFESWTPGTEMTPVKEKAKKPFFPGRSCQCRADTLYTLCAFSICTKNKDRFVLETTSCH
jgi:hypothetical protein